MSRTDAHAPSHVRLIRGDLTAQPWHARIHEVCDLPALDATARHGWRTTNCVWAFRYTGVNECSCASCHGGPRARAANRAGRHRDRTALGAALQVWRTGDDTAFDDVVPPRRR